jgi:probable phosphoglycerate mutase
MFHEQYFLPHTILLQEEKFFPRRNAMHLPSQVVLVRHAESTLNVAKAKSPVFFKTEEARLPFLGVPDHEIDLTPRGEQQAAETGAALCRNGLAFDVAYHSGYKRTVRTLEEILGAYPGTRAANVDIHYSILLREREPGYTYNMTEAEAALYFPWLQEYWAMQGPVFARPPGGTSVADVIERTLLFLNDMHAQHRGQKVLLSLHGRVYTAIRFLYERWTYEELESFLRGKGPRNCCVTIYEPSDSGHTLVLRDYDLRLR